jgi:HSP20 family molecular chaperone IbpA
MGIMDKVSSLLPGRSREPSRTSPRPDALALRDDMDRWLQRLVEEPWGLLRSADVHETDDAVVVTANVPGLEPDDLTLMLTPDALVIRGEKREEREDTRDDMHVAERREGSFAWSIPLPQGVDLERAEARVKNGVLTVRFPKLTASAPPARRVPIKAA